MDATTLLDQLRGYQSKNEASIDQVVEAFEAADGEISQRIVAIEEAFQSVENQLLQRAHIFFSSYRKAVSLQEQSTIILKQHYTFQESKLSKKKHSIHALEIHLIPLQTKKTSVPSSRKPNLRLPLEFTPSSMHTEALQKLLKLYLPLHGSIPPRDLTTLNIVQSISSPGKDLLRFQFPWGVAVHPFTGNVYTCEEDRNRIVCLDSSLKYINHFVSEESSSASSSDQEPPSRVLLKGPRGIAVSYDGRIAVADYSSSSVVIMTEDYQPVKVLGKKDSSGGNFSSPYHVCFDTQNNLYVADSGNRRIQKFDEQGNFVCSFGGKQGTPVTISASVNGVAVDEHGYVYLLHAGADKIKVFNPDTTLSHEIEIKRIGSGGWGNLTRGPNDTLVVSDSNHNEIRFYSLSGDHLHTVHLESPLGVAFGLDGTMYASSVSASTITQY
eukprot:TRINITY_DN779_c0_g1_i1.p1 TRINITY_DN779_c0_g1~~TRINITY_DN779_c0_g1_i1.p1  ORF type:complete len:440 (-),score=110.96 TRINITY_DN779_c0_g1_i1:82-1401(-)